MLRRLGVIGALGALLAALAFASPAQAITGGSADGGRHPYVGQVVFYDPDGSDSRYADAGGWETCSATLMSSTIVLTAGHCTYGVGRNGASTTATGDGSGGNDVWVSFDEAPGFDSLRPSSDFTTNADRYASWSAAFDASPQWHRAMSFPHPEFDPASFTAHDAGVLRLESPVTMSTYGTVPTAGLLDQLFTQKNTERYTPVGYGAEQSGPKGALGGGTRRTADMMLVNLNGALGYGKGASAKFSANSGAAHAGGTCYGDSGGPVLRAGTTTVVAVISFTANSSCAGSSGGYRIDQPDDLDFLASFGVR